MLLTTPRNYQSNDVQLMHENDARYLGYDMGCGKSLPVVAYIDQYRPKMSLILCPKPVVPVWPKEFKKHLGKDMEVLVVPLDRKPGKKTTMSGKQKLELMREKWKAADKAGWPIVFILNHESARMEPMASALTGVKKNWDLAVIDEIHKCKNPSGTSGRFIGKLGKKADKRVGLSGTPMPHSPLDIWAQFRFLDKKIFGWNFNKFKSEHTIMDPNGFWAHGKPVQILRYKNLENLNKKFYSIATRVTKDEVLDLPEATHLERFLDPDAATKKAYKEMHDNLVTEVKGEDCVAANAMVKVTRLQQITSGFVKTDAGVELALHELKKREIVNIMNDLDPKEPVCFFCRFHWDLRAVESAAEELDRPFYGLWSGRDDVDACWKPKPGGMLAAQVSSGSVGIDLTTSTYNVYVSQTWNMGEYDQSLSRSHRHGQERPVFYIHLLMRDSVDEKIRAALAKRAELIDTTLSQSEFNEMILDSYRKDS